MDIRSISTIVYTLSNTYCYNTNDNWKAEILEKWKESARLPRKKKKRVRKELKLDWAIACWKPEFNF